MVSLDDFCVYLMSRAQHTYRIVTGSDDKKVKVVAAETGKVAFDKPFHDDCVCTVLYTKEFFVSCSGDR